LRRGFAVKASARSHRRLGCTITDVHDVLDRFAAVTITNKSPISLPYSGLERDFCRRRQTRKKGAGDDVSKRRPEIGDHDAREMAAKTAFLLASCQLRVSEDWVVGAPGLELGTR
jgi:hypothetical protein